MFYTTFEKLCHERRIAPSSVARKLGMSSSAPGRWKCGSSPDLPTAEKLADFFGVTIDYLVKGGADNNGTVKASNGSIVVNGNNNTSTAEASRSTGQLTEMESEMLRIFRMMDMRHKSATMSNFYEIEDELKGG